MTTTLRDGIVKTRKEHKCHGCLEKIPKGTNTYSQTIVDDDIYTIYMCDDCKDYCKNKKCTDCYTLEQAYEGYIKECKKEG